MLTATNTVIPTAVKFFNFLLNLLSLLKNTNKLKLY